MGQPVPEVVRSIVIDTARYFNLFNDSVEARPKVQYRLRNYHNQSVSEIREYLRQQGLDPVVIGNGSRIIRHYPAVGNTLSEGERVFLLTNGQNITVPNLHRWSARDVMSFTRLAGLRYQSTGFGVVRSQSVPPGHTVTSGDVLKVELVPLFR